MTNQPTTSLDVTQVAPVHTIVASTGEERLATVMDEYLVSLEQGTPLDLQAVIDQHPDLAEEIRSIAASLDLLHQTTRQMRPATETQSTPAVAKRLGDFEIGRELGRGGMGVVYQAKQISLHRRVALKVLPFAAMWDQKQIARFRNEALAAAQLHHPHIVPVFAVGEERGVHFYAMQLIDGQSLDQLVLELRGVDENTGVEGTGDETAASEPTQPQALASTVTWRTTEINTPTSLSTQHSHDRSEYCQAIARLGRQAAEALHHAHEYGVVHRDIKPSNLMVDGQAKLWITDFGLARIQSSPGVTITGDVVGTLRYMSPEQAAGQHALVDTRTDIYGLGATLYELLTLRPAFPGEDRHGVLRDIAEKEPVPPRTLNPAIPVDLETIVLQAMSKSRDARYQAAQALADDLDRFLQGKPTLARRPTVVDRTAKWMKRHRSLVAVSALFLVTISLVSTLAALRIAREQERTEAALAEAEQNLVQANANFTQARRVVDRFGIQLADQLQTTPGTERLRQQLLIETLRYYREFASQIDGQLGVQDQLAMTYLKSGVVTAKLGADRKAMAEYQAAQQIMEQLLQEDPTNTHLKSQLALSRNNMALLLAAAGNIPSAQQEFDRAIADQQQLVATDPSNAEFAGQLAESYVNLGTLLGETDQMDAAVRSLYKAIEILQVTHEARPAKVDVARSLAMAYNNLGYLERGADLNAAQQAASRAVELLERSCRGQSTPADCLADLSLCYGNLAAIQNAAEQATAALATYQRAIALGESLVRTSPGVVRHRSDLAANLNNVALLQIQTGNTSAANEAFARANQLFAGLLEDYPDQLAYASGWAALLNNQGLALAKLERYDDAIGAYEQAVKVQNHVWLQLSDSEAVRDALSRIYYNYGQALKNSGRINEATQQALARRDLWSTNPQRLFSLAVELAELAQVEPTGENELLTEELINTLTAALRGGYQPEVALRQDERFRRWHDNPQFRALTKMRNRDLATNLPVQQALP